jgi:hypothetical protein
LEQVIIRYNEGEKSTSNLKRNVIIWRIVKAY